MRRRPRMRTTRAGPPRELRRDLLLSHAARTLPFVDIDGAVPVVVESGQQRRPISLPLREQRLLRFRVRRPLGTTGAAEIADGVEIVAGMDAFLAVTIAVIVTPYGFISMHWRRCGCVAVPDVARGRRHGGAVRVDHAIARVVTQDEYPVTGSAPEGAPPCVATIIFDSILHAITNPRTGQEGERRDDGDAFHHHRFAFQFHIVLLGGAVALGVCVFDQPRAAQRFESGDERADGNDYHNHDQHAAFERVEAQREIERRRHAAVRGNRQSNSAFKSTSCFSCSPNSSRGWAPKVNTRASSTSGNCSMLTLLMLTLSL